MSEGLERGAEIPASDHGAEKPAVELGHLMVHLEHNMIEET